MLAERIILSSPASSPMSYAPKPSPISALRLIACAMHPPANPTQSVPGKPATVRFLSAGDRALVVEFGDHIDRALSEEVLRLASSLRSTELAGVVETVPTFRSLMVHYDPLVTSRAELERAIAGRLDRQTAPRDAATRWRVPVCYEAEFAPDLAEVARL